MKIYAFAALLLLVPGSSSLFADDLDWGGTYVANWDNFGTSPYTATDVTLHQGLTLFCLDFNDEIAPPFSWTASIMSLTQANVAGTGAYAGQYAAQYGGAYNSLLTASFNNPAITKPATETAAPQVSGPPFAFSGDTSAGAGAYSVTLSGSDAAYTRYLEAAWLFTNIQAAVAQSPMDIATDMVAQAAAWELFVNSSNLATLTSDVNNYAGSYSFKNYLGLAPSQTYLTTSTVSTQATAGISFEQAVDAALAAAQNAVTNLSWGPGSSHYGSWSLVTGTADYSVAFGRPVQEFLSPNAVPNPPRQSPVPEPKAVCLLATALSIVIWLRRSPRVA